MTQGANAAALLIDADNLSPEGMSDALAHLLGEGLRVSVRRAYGSHETLGGAAKEFLQAASFRAIVNQGKGTTDSALVVDAMDLLHAGCLPRVVGLGSADGDFAPLVVRLREAGMTVICFAQRRKAPEGLARFYDRVIYVDEVRAPPVRADAPAAAPVARKAPKKTAKAKPAAVPTQALLVLDETDRIRDILEGFPGFTEGEEIELGEAVKKLRDEKLMSKSMSARTFFKKHMPEVELLPENNSHKLRQLPRKTRR